MRLLLIDNYDSFTFNLVQYFKELDCQVQVVRNDELTLSQIASLQPELIVLSPGPCSPDQAGICLSVVRHFAGRLPILGVCLGHQVIAQAFGGQVARAAKVMHGKVSSIKHVGHTMFASIPENFSVTRYHSLVVSEESLPEEIMVTAESIVIEKVTGEEHGTGEIMAIAHRTMPLWGVQFHPESYLTEHGHQFLNNIITLSASWSR